MQSMKKFTTGALLIFAFSFPGSAVENPATSDFAGEPVCVLDDPSMYNVTDISSGPDPVAANAEAIRKRIDPTKSQEWSRGGFKEEYKEFILETYSSYDEFWNRIPASERRLVDLNNDGVMECCVVSRGLKTTAWGFSDFFAVFEKDVTSGSGDWKLALIHVLDNTKWADGDLPMVVTDLDRNGRPDVLFTTLAAGASASGYYLHVISISNKGKYAHHTLDSAAEISVLNPDQLRPLFVQSFYDDWGPDDVGASVRSRGFRRAYCKWLSQVGFVRQ